MLKKTITYEDFNGQTRTEDFYFNLTKSELIELELSKNGFTEHMQRITTSGDGKLIMDTFKEIIFRAYGERSEDGRRFIKKPELSEGFSQTLAYDVFFLELVTDPNAAVDFIRGLVPADLAKAVQAEMAKEALQKAQQPAVQEVQLPTAPPVVSPNWQPQQPTTEPILGQALPAPEPFVTRPPHESGPGYTGA